MDVIWHKIWRDLADNRIRTTLVVISTAVGILALGLVFGLSGVMGARLAQVHRQAVPTHVTFSGGPFSPDTVEAIGHERGVQSAQGEIVASLRWQLADGSPSEWHDGQLVAREDYDQQRMDLLRLLAGNWPGGREPYSSSLIVGIDRLSGNHFSVDPGTPILIESGQRGQRVSVRGIVYDYDVLSPGWGGVATFYTTPEDVMRLVDYPFQEDFNRLHVRVDGFSHRKAEETAERIEDRLERMGLTAGGYTITDPSVHPMQELVDAVLIVLGVMGGLSLGLSGFLIVNIINAILARQVKQIGVMKSIGATLVRILAIYLSITLIYGALALMLAVPLGVLGAHLVAVWLLDMLNVALDTFQFEPLAALIQIVIGLAVPPAAAFLPVLNAARITVREAISDYGLVGDFGHNWLDQLVAQIRGLPRLVILGLRNTFRSKKRVALTLLMLVFSGAMFIVVMSTQAALESTFRVIFELEGNVSLELERAYRASRLVEIAQQIPGVAQAEAWHQSPATIPTPQGEDLPVKLTGVPAGSALFSPRIIAGRSLEAGDGRAILVNNRLVEEEGVRTGDRITLDVAGVETEWTVVGSYLSLNVLRDVCFVPREALAHETHTQGEGTILTLLSENNDTESHQRLIDDLTHALEANNVEVGDAWSAAQQWEESRSAFSVLIYLLLTMAVLVATVGSIGLMSTMSVNVVERTREIGVMRAIGGTSPIVAAIFVVEGMTVGVLSWLLAVPLSAPGAYALSAVVGQAIIRIPLDFAYSVDGVLLWLLIVVALSALASLWPTLRAMRTSIRESLAYE